MITNIYNLPQWNCSQQREKWFFWWQLEMFDVYTTGDTAHIDTIFKFLPHTHTNVSMGASIFFTAAMIRAFVSARSRGNSGTNTRPLTYSLSPKKLQGVMSGGLGGHSISGWSFPDARPIQRPGNTVFRYWRTSQWKWAGLPSCWDMNVGVWH